ncbi:hypothetical protein BH20GEM3_BH20GEM3_05040 [soil metagenome]
MLPAQLRPLTLGEILDAAFALYRRHFGTLFLTAVLPMLPVVAFWAAFPLFARGAPEQVTELANLGGWLLAPYTIPATLLVWGALLHQVSLAYLDSPISVREGYRRGVRRLLPLLGATFAASVLIGLGLVLLVIPGILLLIMFFAVGPAVVIESRGPIEALGRSRELARGAWGRIFAVLFLLFLITALPTFALAAATGVGALASGSGAVAVLESPWIFTAFQALSVLLSALTTPFMTAGLVLLYYDRRVRSEALDVELAANGLAPVQ